MRTLFTCPYLLLTNLRYGSSAAVVVEVAVVEGAGRSRLGSSR